MRYLICVLSLFVATESAILQPYPFIRIEEIGVAGTARLTGVASRWEDAVAVGVTNLSPDSDLDILAVRLRWGWMSDTLLWSQSIGGPHDDFAAEVIFGEQWHNLVAGHTYSYGPNTPACSNGYLVLIGESGELLWSRVLGGEGWDEYYSAAYTSDQQFVLAGRTTEAGDSPSRAWIVRIDTLGNLISSYVEESYAVSVARVVRSSGLHTIIAAEVSDCEACPRDLMVMKMDSLGAVVWQQRYFTPDDERVSDLNVAPYWQYFACGSVLHAGENHSQAWCAQLSAAGELIWMTSWGNGSMTVAAVVSYGYAPPYTRLRVLGYELNESTGRFNANFATMSSGGLVTWQYAIDSLGNSGFVAGTSAPYAGDRGHCFVVGFADSGNGADMHGLVGEVEGEGTKVGDFAGGLTPERIALTLFPNPFNATARIVFDLPRVMQVKLGLYDVNGRYLQTLADDQFAAGEHRVAVDGSQLSSGAYFVRLIGDEVEQTQKVVVLK